MLTPSKYWRVACDLNCENSQPPSIFTLPTELASQTNPPVRGHGITIAAYDETEQMGMLRWLGIIISGTDTVRQVDWKATSAQIWIDSDTGRRYWKAGGFGFAQKKIADYGLHELWQENFSDLELRNHTPMAIRPRRSSRASSNCIAPERLNPIEVIGQAITGNKAGVVYILKSAYGYKVGRTKNIPARMRAFGVKLPIIYTIPLCIWFEDCHEAERRYHEMFASKRINGEWFDLDDSDLQVIKFRAKNMASR